MDSFLVEVFKGIGADLVTDFVKRSYQKLFGAGCRRVEDEARYYPPATAQSIVINIGNYIHAVDEEMGKNHRIDATAAAEKLDIPSIQRLLSSSAQVAAVTKDALTTDALASLVIAALEARSGTRIEQAVLLAEKALEKLRPENLMQLAKIFALKTYQLPDDVSDLPNREMQLDAIEKDLTPAYRSLSNVRTTYLDGLFLEEVGTVNFRASLSGFSNPRFEPLSPGLQAIIFQPGETIGERSALSWFLNSQSRALQATDYGPAHFAFQASGLALGYVTLMQLVDSPVDLSSIFGSD